MEGSLVRVNLLLAGVGGQGLITMGKIIAEACSLSNTRVLVAETHGLAQRGGAVNVHVRIGDVMAPLIPLGEANYLVALEAMEALRNINYCNKETNIVLNREVVRPVVPKVKMLSIKDVSDTLAGYRTFTVDASKMAHEAGNPRAANVVMIGFLYGLGAFRDLVDRGSFLKAVRSETNVRAFEAGEGIAMASRLTASL